jgi:hypothetical protein
VNVYFLDSSALVKRYVMETGTNWLRGLIDANAQNALILARITWVETLSALARKQREGRLAQEDVRQAILTFQYDLDMQYRIVEVDATLIKAAGNLVMKHPLRAYDAVQLASALRVQAALTRLRAPALTFLAADSRLLAIAQTEGLLIANPNDHP